MKNAGRAGIVPKDDFDINIKYKRLDAVMYDKSLYIAKKDVPLGTLPTDTTYWMKSIYGNKEPIATTETAGVVKPDGDTITVDEDGTLHGQSKVSEMTGATAEKDGTSGTVPEPKAGQEELFLRGDGTWREAGTNITVDSELSKESTNPIENRAAAEEFEKKLNLDGDSKDLTATFTSNDSTNVTEWTDVGLLTSGEKHSSLFQKVATMFKNIRYLYHMLGTADISTLGEGANIGTVTGAISKLNSDCEWKQETTVLGDGSIDLTNIEYKELSIELYDETINTCYHTIIPKCQIPEKGAYFYICGHYAVPTSNASIRAIISTTNVKIDEYYLNGSTTMNNIILGVWYR